MEEECSDSSSEDNKPTPTNSDDQVNISIDCNNVFSKVKKSFANQVISNRYDNVYVKAS